MGSNLCRASDKNRAVPEESKGRPDTCSDASPVGLVPRLRLQASVHRMGAAVSVHMASVLCMQIAHPDQHQLWRQLRIHTSTSSNSAPWLVQLQLAALVGDHEIAASYAQFVTTGPSIWSVLAVTDDDRLVKVVVEFDDEGYDLDQEQSFRDKTPEHTVVEAWVRRLKDAVRLEMKVGQRRDNFNQPARDQVDVGDVRLKFVGAEDVDLGVDQLKMAYYEDRERTDQLITVIRTHTGL
jgi:hypothetical protein